MPPTDEESGNENDHSISYGKCVKCLFLYGFFLALELLVLVLLLKVLMPWAYAKYLILNWELNHGGEIACVLRSSIWIITGLVIYGMIQSYLAAQESFRRSRVRQERGFIGRIRTVYIRYDDYNDGLRGMLAQLLLEPDSDDDTEYDTETDSSESGYEFDPSSDETRSSSGDDDDDNEEEEFSSEEDEEVFI